MDKNQILQSIKFVVERSTNVKINTDRIKLLAKKMAQESLSIPFWPTEYHLANVDEKTLLNYLFVLDALNFSFWPDEGAPKWEIEYKGKWHGGYYGLSLALKKAFESGVPITNFKYLKNIKADESVKIFSGRGEIPLFNERLNILRSCSEILDRNYEGQFINFMRSVKNRALDLVLKIVKELPSFDDRFLKRAQILVGDIWGCFNGIGLGEFSDIDNLTAFADYKLPQILNHFGILEYSPALTKKIRNLALIESGSKEEIEIRAATIWAVEFLKDALCDAGVKINSIQTDWILWNKSQEINFELPYHRTRTVYY